MAKKSKKLRIGMIGVGGIGNVHVGYLVKFDDAEVVAVCDIKKDRLAEMKEKYGIERGYEDWHKMLAAEDLDAVSVCTPNYLHCEPTVDALEAGCHVICEKPLAMNGKEGQRMVDAAKKAGKELVTGFQWRFTSSVQFIKRAYDAGHLGDVMFAKVHAMRRRGIPNWGVFGEKELQGGGPLIDIGVHAIEMTHYAMGSPRPVAASGQIWTYIGNKKSKTVSQWPGWDYKKYTVEDLAVGMIRFENGAVMHVESMFAGHIGKDQQKHGFELMGTKGGATQDPPMLCYDRDGTMVDVEPGYLEKSDHFEIKMRKFVDVALYGKVNESTGEDGLMVQKMLDGIYRSAEKGKEVAIV